MDFELKCLIFVSLYGRFEESDWPQVETTATTPSVTESRRQRAIRRQRTHPSFDHIRASSATQLPVSTNELPVRRQSGDDGDTVTPSFVDGDVIGEKPWTQSTGDETEITGQLEDQRTPSLTVGDQRSSQTRPFIQQKVSNGDVSRQRRNTSRGVLDAESDVPGPTRRCPG